MPITHVPFISTQHRPSSSHNTPYWTTNAGAPVWNNNSSLTGKTAPPTIAHAITRDYLVFFDAVLLTSPPCSPCCVAGIGLPLFPLLYPRRVCSPTTCLPASMLLSSVTLSPALTSSSPLLIPAVGPRGPILLEDYHLVEKLAQFDRERIPERVVHARGAVAKGFFEVRGEKIWRSSHRYRLDDHHIKPLNPSSLLHTHPIRSPMTSAASPAPTS